MEAVSYTHLDVYKRQNKAFLATTGLTIQAGATNPDNAETIIKTSMMKRSQENFLLTDSSKFDRTSLRTFANIEDFNKIITSGSVPKHYVEYCLSLIPIFTSLELYLCVSMYEYPVL